MAQMEKGDLSPKKQEQPEIIEKATAVKKKGAATAVAKGTPVAGRRKPKRTSARSRLTLADAARILEEYGERIAAIEKALNITTKPSAVTVTYEEFASGMKPKNIEQRILTAGYYLEKYQGMKSFSAADIKNTLVSAKVAGAKKMTPKTVKNIKKKYISEAKGKKGGKRAWHLTKTGQKLIESNFRK